MSRLCFSFFFFGTRIWTRALARRHCAAELYPQWEWTVYNQFVWTSSWSWESRTEEWIPIIWPGWISLIFCLTLSVHTLAFCFGFMSPAYPLKRPLGAPSRLLVEALCAASDHTGEWGQFAFLALTFFKDVHPPSPTPAFATVGCRAWFSHSCSHGTGI